MVGLTGGVGSGKSTVADMLVELGATLIDSDRIVHELQAAGSPLLAEIAKAFGDHFINASGKLDRKALGDLVFRDPEARERLNRLVHPAVGAEILRRVVAARERGDPLVVVDIPLLFETRKAAERPRSEPKASGGGPPQGVNARGASSALSFHATVLVWVSEAVQIERQITRDGCDRDEALRRVRAQMNLSEKRALADFVVDNSSDLKKTRARCATSTTS